MISAPEDTELTAVVVERMPLVRLGLETSLERAGVTAVTHTDELGDGVAAIRRLGAGLLVLGRAEPDTPGELRRHGPQLAGVDVVVLIERAERDNLVALLEAGVMGVALRSIASEDLATLVGTVLAGERAVGPAMVSVLIGLGSVHLDVDRVPAAVTVDGGAVVVPTASRRIGDAAPLTTKELQVLTRLAQGESNAAIAEALYVSVPTVKTHLAHIYAKLGVGGRHEATSRAVALGLLH